MNNVIVLQWYTRGPSPGRSSIWFNGDIYFRTMLKKLKAEIVFFPNHILGHKYYMLQKNSVFKLDCSSMLDIYLRHCLKIAFELFHVNGLKAFITG